MNNLEKADALDVMIHTAGWQVFIDEIIGTPRDVTRGKWGQTLISLSKKKKETTLDYARGILEGLEYARDMVKEKIIELRKPQENHNPEG